MEESEIHKLMCSLWDVAIPCWMWPHPLERFIAMHDLFAFDDMLGPLFAPVRY